MQTIGRPVGYLSALMALAIGLASCGKDQQAATAGGSDSSPVLATVAGEAITEADFQAEVAHRASRRQPIPDKAALLAEMAERRALLHRARAAGLDTDVAVRREFDNLLISQLRARELEDELRSATVSEEALQAAYQARIGEFTRPAKVRVAILKLVAGQNASDGKRAEVRARIEQARTKALADPAPGGRGPAAGGFGALAINYSEDQASRYRGGDIGWLDHGSYEYRWPREVLEAAYSGETGIASEVIEIDGIFYLAMRTDFRAAAVQPFSEARTSLLADLLRVRRQQLQEDFRDETKRSAGIAVDEEALAAVQMPASIALPAPPPADALPPALPAGATN